MKWLKRIVLPLENRWPTSRPPTVPHKGPLIFHCPSCRTPVAKAATHCPSCGEVLPDGT